MISIQSFYSLRIFIMRWQKKRWMILAFLFFLSDSAYPHEIDLSCEGTRLDMEVGNSISIGSDSTIFYTTESVFDEEFLFRSKFMVTSPVLSVADITGAKGIEMLSGDIYRTPLRVNFSGGPMKYSPGGADRVALVLNMRLSSIDLYPYILFRTGKERSCFSEGIVAGDDGLSMGLSFSETVRESTVDDPVVFWDRLFPQQSANVFLFERKRPFQFLTVSYLVNAHFAVRYAPAFSSIFNIVIDGAGAHRLTCEMTQFPVLRSYWESTTYDLLKSSAYRLYLRYRYEGESLIFSGTYRHIRSRREPFASYYQEYTDELVCKISTNLIHAESSRRVRMEPTGKITFRDSFSLSCAFSLFDVDMQFSVRTVSEEGSFSSFQADAAFESAGFAVGVTVHDDLSLEADLSYSCIDINLPLTIKISTAKTIRIDVEFTSDR